MNNRLYQMEAQKKWGILDKLKINPMIDYTQN
jgi:hypothetical protein